jgi:hypothetical protein
MQIRRLTRPFLCSLLVAVGVSGAGAATAAEAHDDHDTPTASRPHKHTTQENAAVAAVRAATKRFKDVKSIAGPGEGYELQFGCVSGGDFGAMGLHYVNLALVDGAVEPSQPEIILFEPTPGGGVRITGADYLVPAAAWDLTAHNGPPQLFGQLFHLFETPNRFGLDTFYTLHVWAWKDNPNGTFVNWNPEVSCDAFNAPQAEP